MISTVSGQLGSSLLTILRWRDDQQVPVRHVQPTPAGREFCPVGDTVWKPEPCVAHATCHIADTFETPVAHRWLTCMHRSLAVCMHPLLLAGCSTSSCMVHSASLLLSRTSRSAVQIARCSYSSPVCNRSVTQEFRRSHERPWMPLTDFYCSHGRGNPAPLVARWPTWSSVDSCAS